MSWVLHSKTLDLTEIVHFKGLFWDCVGVGLGVPPCQSGGNGVPVPVGLTDTLVENNGPWLLVRTGVQASHLALHWYHTGLVVWESRCYCSLYGRSWEVTTGRCKGGRLLLEEGGKSWHPIWPFFDPLWWEEKDRVSLFLGEVKIQALSMVCTDPSWEAVCSL